MPTPTSDAGLPDLAALTRLANEFFSALPGGASAGALSGLAAGAGGAPTQPPASLRAFASPAAGGVPLPVNPLPGGVSPGPVANGPSLPGEIPGAGVVPGANLLPTSPQTAANLGAQRPALVPHATSPNGLPDLATTATPALDSRAGGQVLGIPQRSEPALPGAGALPALPARPSLPSTSALPASSSAPALHPSSSAPLPHAPPVAGPAAPAAASPFYFLDTAGVTPAAAAPAGLPDDLVSAQSFGLPGAESLRALQAVTPGPVHAPAPPASGSPFYFVDPQRHPGPQGHHAGAPPPAAATARPPFDVHAIRRDFPILSERVNGRPLAWFDNAATTQKPQSVIDRLSYFYEHENSNIHRAAHELAARATDAYEAARQKVARFIGAASPEEIIFVRGTTEAINLIAKSWGAKNIGEGDEIIVSHLEHHANIVPWQQLCAATGAVLRVIPVDDSGQVILSEYQRLLGPRTKLVSVTQVSNALGTVVPVQEIVEIAHRHGVCALVDGAQSVSHMRVDVQKIDADFFVFSGHKVFGPTGIGVVYGKRAVLADMPPWQGGGNMIQDVTFERTIYHPPPARFEAGTGNIADAVGLGAAIDYVERIGIENIGRYEHELLEYATAAIRPIPGLRLIGTARDKASVLSFVLEGHSTDEVGQALNREGIAVRTGHHCAQPILRRFGLETTVRPSLAFYNTCEEVDRLATVVRRLAGGRH